MSDNKRFGFVPGVGTAWLCVLVLVGAYSFLSGPYLDHAMGDSFIYADMAKHIAYEHKLKADHQMGFIYPPLYSALIAPVYTVITNPAHIAVAIKCLNIFLYSVVVFPLYSLFRSYAQVSSGTQALWGSVLLSVSPHTLHYSVWFMGEPLYISLVASFIYLMMDRYWDRGIPQALGFGALLGAIILTKQTGYTILFALVLTEGISHIYGTRRIGRGLIMSLSVAAILYAAYKISMPRPSGYLNMLSYPQLRSVTYWADRISSALAYVFVSPNSMVSLFPAIVLLRWGREIILKDTLFLFSCIMLLGVVLTTALFTAPDGSHIFHGRYFMPFMFIPALITLRHRERFDSAVLIAILAASFFIAFMAGAPGGVAAFAPSYSDGMVGNNIVRSAGGLVSEWQINLAWVVWMAITSAYIFKNKARFVLMLFLVIFLTSGFVNGVQYFYNRIPACFPTCETADVVGKMASLKEDSGTVLYVQRNWGGNPAWEEMATILFAYPSLVRPVDWPELRDDVRGRTALLTYEKLSCASLLAEGKAVKLYLLEQDIPYDCLETAVSGR